MLNQEIVLLIIENVILTGANYNEDINIHLNCSYIKIVNFENGFA